ncbi:MAG: nucleotide exchange factor GrpE [Gemmatimonadota bacterium]
MWSNKQSDPAGDESAHEAAEEETTSAAEVEAPDPLEELEDLRDRHLRLVAEFENFRKRTRREQAELRPTAQADLVRRLLPTLDDLARVSAIPHETTTVEALDAGVELILRNLVKELDESGLKRIDAVGKPFDPEFHEGILIAEVDDPELDHTVSRVLLEGYEFAGRLVRPAQVEIYQYTEPFTEPSTEPVDD